MDAAPLTPGPRLALPAGLAGLAASLLAVALALAHLRDLSRIQHIAGVWMGLARALDHGTLYPPLEDDGFYGGTRYMPAVFVLIAALARLTGEYLAAAKLAALLTTLALAGGLLAVIRRATGRWADGALAVGVFLTLPEGFNALASPHADALSAAFAVWGLWLLGDDPPWGRLSLAALLFALAFLTKFSAVAGPAAAGLWLFFGGRRAKAAGVVVLSAALALLGVAALQWASGGRMTENFNALASGGMSGDSVRIGPARLLLALCRLTPFLLVWPAALWCLLPFSGPAADEARSASEGDAEKYRPRWGVWQWYLLCALGTTAVIFTSPGTEFNHLVELEAACLIVLSGRFLTGRSTAGAARLIAVAAIAWGSLSFAGPTDPSAISVSRLAAAVPRGSRVLAEDASVPIALGQRPAVLDPFSFRILAGRGLIDDEALAKRVREQEFDALVMLARIEDPGESLCPRFHFGPAVTAAMLRSYRYHGSVGRYHVYRPAGPSLARPSPPEQPAPTFSSRRLMRPAQSSR